MIAGLRRSRGVWAVVSAVAVCLGSFAGSVASAPAASANGAHAVCASVNVLALRGSGEDQKTTDEAGPYTDLTSDRWEGPTLRRALKAYELAASDAKVSTDQTRILDIGWDFNTHTGYQAIGLLPAATEALIRAPLVNPELAHSFALAAIYRSAKTGVVAGLDRMETTIKSTPDACAIGRFVALGYSQGAMAARLIYEGTSLKVPISAAMTFGDPFQQGEPTKALQASASLYGTGANGTGMFIKKDLSWVLPVGDKIDKDALASFYESKIHRYSLCHSEDPYCDYNWLISFLNLKPHDLYVKTQGQLSESEAVGWTSKRELEAQGESRDVGRWLLQEIGGAKVGQEPAQPAPAPKPALQLTQGPGPWIPGREARLNLVGLPTGAQVTVKLIPTGSAADQQAAGPSIVTAYPREKVGDVPMLVPPYMSRGSHGIDLPTYLAGGSYDAVIVTSLGSVTKHVDVEDPLRNSDWAYASEAQYAADPSKWWCQSADDTCW